MVFSIRITLVRRVVFSTDAKKPAPRRLFALIEALRRYDDVTYDWVGHCVTEIKFVAFARRVNETYFVEMIKSIEETVNEFPSGDAKDEGRAAVKVLQKIQEEGRMYADVAIQV